MEISLHPGFHPFFVEGDPFYSNLSSALFDCPAAERSVGRSFRPTLELMEQPTEYRLSADLPGLGEEDITLELSQRVLTLSADKEEVREVRAEDGSVKSTTRKSRSFKRAVQLPEDVDESAISASMDRGVLSIVLPKAPESQPRRIGVSGGAPKPASVDGQKAPAAAASEE